ncbi:hypothetical protein FHS56_000489 [Thermonema lapsum]|uniref:Uncharacterized protein n=1 Tax=Thermonema lapsum TaxID=28195 RepID=A0A846MN72_9BACT|nr:hypothetical protein [Thermonema lapsum]NIK73003.1 hypothetical protein [Thermonema lapsum]
MKKVLASFLILAATSVLLAENGGGKGKKGNEELKATKEVVVSNDAKEEANALSCKVRLSNGTVITCTLCNCRKLAETVLEISD